MKNNLTEVIALYSDNIPVSDFTETVKIVKEKLKLVDTAKEVRFTISAFGSDGANYKRLCENVPAEKLTPKKLFFSEDTYKVALIDSAIGLIEEVGKRYCDTPEEEIPARIVFLTIVFGKDNASKKSTYDDLRNVIEHQSEIYKWEFYLISDEPFIAEKLSVKEENCVFVHTDTEGFFTKAVEEICEKISAVSKS